MTDAPQLYVRTGGRGILALLASSKLAVFLWRCGAMKLLTTSLAVLLCALIVAPASAQQSALPAAPSRTPVQARAEQMRLTTTSQHARELFGQAVTLSGNYRL